MVPRTILVTSFLLAAAVPAQAALIDLAPITGKAAEALDGEAIREAAPVATILSNVAGNGPDQPVMVPTPVGFVYAHATDAGAFVCADLDLIRDVAEAARISTCAIDPASGPGRAVAVIDTALTEPAVIDTRELADPADEPSGWFDRVKAFLGGLFG